MYMFLCMCTCFFGKVFAWIKLADQCKALRKCIFSLKLDGHAEEDRKTPYRMSLALRVYVHPIERKLSPRLRVSVVFLSLLRLLFPV